MKFKPYYLFIPAAIIFFIAGLFPGDSTVDLHLHDTYFVFSDRYFHWLLAVLFIGFFLVYLTTNTILFSDILTWIHVGVTLSGVTILTIYSLSNEGKAGMPGRYLNYGDFFNSYIYFKNIVRMIALVFILVQLLYVVNLFAGLIRWFTTKNKVRVDAGN